MNEEFNQGPVNGQQNQKTEEKGKGMFYLVLVAAIVIVAIFGATYAYFTSNITTDTGDISVGSTNVPVSLSKEVDSFSPTDLIPAVDNIALYAFEDQTSVSYTCSNVTGDNTVSLTEAEYIAYLTGESEDDTVNYDSCVRDDNSRCVDDNGDSVCGYYHFKLSNSEATVRTISSLTLSHVSNTFTNLEFVIYAVQNGDVVRVTDPMLAPNDTTPLLSTAADVSNNETQITLASGVASTLLHQSFSSAAAAEYYIVTWLHDDNTAQNDTDGNKEFSATLGINIVDGGRVTGTISAAG